MINKKILPHISRPGRYLGHEYNSSIKPWNAVMTRCALIFPDLYEIGMSHQGLQILYHILNGNDKFLAERCYCPDTDVEKLIREKNETVTTLESGRPLIEFDIIGFTLPYELCYTNILTVLDLAGLPFFSVERDDDHPVILAGGAGALNPEPVADFFDAILLGDGEEAVLEIAEIIGNTPRNKRNRKKLLERLGEIEGVYIPSHFKPVYNKAGHTVEIKHLHGSQPYISRRIIPNLDHIDHLKHPIVPNARIVHDRLGIEVARGCTRGCRFCQAGIIYRPVRERTPQQIKELAIAGIEDSGFEELALLSLSTGDYSCLEQALPELMNRFTDSFTSVSMPSLRVGTLTPTIMDQIKRVRKTGFTLAPEAGSERLRRVINKGISEEDLLSTCREAFGLGWKLIKLYFMIGLPTETEKDHEEIVELVKKAKLERDRGTAKGKKQINVSVGTFVPKPHTPFQWERQLAVEESYSILKRLKNNLRLKGVNLKYHNPDLSFLEGVFSRGDRRLARLIVTAWNNGARLDGWTEHFQLKIWRKAAQKCQIELEDYLRHRSMDEVLPWQHLHSGVDLDFLKNEHKKALSESYTPDCRYHSCQKCGLCDFKTLLPIVHNRSKKTRESALPISAGQDNMENANHYRYIVHYSKRGEICFLGHLEILQVIFRALRRADIKTHYSKGFNPSPKISFGPALAVGTESLAEFFIMDLVAPLADRKTVIKKLNDKLPPGIEVTAMEKHPGKIAQKILTSYTMILQNPLSDEEKTRITGFSESHSFSIQRSRKGKTTSLDVRPMISKLQCTTPDTIELEMVTIASRPGIKPIEILTHIIGIDRERAMETVILKTGWRPMNH
ncbi:TIGR03960 family B12-binding radical SAM protein [Desulfomarina sp.]